MPLLLKLGLSALVIFGIGFGIHKHEVAKREMQSQPTVQTNTALSAGTSDVDLQADLNSMDTQLKTVDQSSADVDAGLNTTETTH